MGILDILSGLYGAGKATMDATGAPRPGNQQAASNRQGGFLDFLPELLTQDMQTQGGKVRDPAARAKQFGPQGVDWVQANGPERDSVKARQAALDGSIGPDPRYGAVEMTPENTKWAEEQLKGAETGPSNPLTMDVGNGIRAARGRDGSAVGFSTSPLSAYDAPNPVQDGSAVGLNGVPMDGFTPQEGDRFRQGIQDAVRFGTTPPRSGTKQPAASQPTESMMASSVIPGESDSGFLSMFDQPAPLPVLEQAPQAPSQSSAAPIDYGSLVSFLTSSPPASPGVQPRQDPRPTPVSVPNPWTNSPSGMGIDLGSLYDAADTGDQMIGDRGVLTDLVKFMQDQIKPSYRSVPAGAPQAKQQPAPPVDPALAGLQGTVPGYLRPLDTRAQQRKAGLGRALDSFNPASMFQR